ncbi:MAG: hypothetical protein K8T91_16920, partial [Planctomycetes bacterium]|nr:hypothetical protein [Planctomycetota bacterium]
MNQAVSRLHTAFSHPFLLSCMTAGIFIMATGCGNTDAKRMQPTVPTAVQVFYKGKPVSDCQVILHPVVEESTPLRRVLPNGQTDAEGRAQLTSYIANDGAPEGE